MAERTTWELLVHLHLDGWTHAMLPAGSRSRGEQVVPLKKGDAPTKVWWTRVAHGPSHAYLLCLATASEIFAKIDLVSSIQHLRPVTYYQQLLEGKVPGKGAHMELVDGQAVHLAFEGEVVLDDMAGRGQGQKRLRRCSANRRGRGRGRGHGELACSHKQLALGGRPGRERRGSGRGRSRGRGGRGRSRGRGGRGRSTGRAGSAGPPPLADSSPQRAPRRPACPGDRDSDGGDDHTRKRNRRLLRQKRRRHPLTSKWMRCQFIVTKRVNERFISLQVNCPFHSSEKRETEKPSEKSEKLEKTTLCTRSRVVRPRPGESSSEALARFKARGRCWLIAAKDAASRKLHMAMADVTDQHAAEATHTEQDAQMRSVWEAWQATHASSSCSSSSDCRSSGSSSTSNSTSSGSGSS